MCGGGGGGRCVVGPAIRRAARAHARPKPNSMCVMALTFLWLLCWMFILRSAPVISYSYLWMLIDGPRLRSAATVCARSSDCLCVCVCHNRCIDVLSTGFFFIPTFHLHLRVPPLMWFDTKVWLSPWLGSTVHKTAQHNGLLTNLTISRFDRRQMVDGTGPGGWDPPASKGVSRDVCCRPIRSTWNRKLYIFLE